MPSRLHFLHPPPFFFPLSFYRSSLCSSEWPGSQINPPCLSFPNYGITGQCHHIPSQKNEGSAQQRSEAFEARQTGTSWVLMQGPLTKRSRECQGLVLIGSLSFLSAGGHGVQACLLAGCHVERGRFMPNGHWDKGTVTEAQEATLHPAALGQTLQLQVLPVPLHLPGEVTSLQPHEVQPLQRLPFSTVRLP